nr:hypothetical protein CFP56_12179 [Quercus suber]
MRCSSFRLQEIGRLVVHNVQQPVKHDMREANLYHAMGGKSALHEPGGEAVISSRHRWHFSGGNRGMFWGAYGLNKPHECPDAVFELDDHGGSISTSETLRLGNKDDDRRSSRPCDRSDARVRTSRAWRGDSKAMLPQGVREDRLADPCDLSSARYHERN